MNGAETARTIPLAAYSRKERAEARHELTAVAREFGLACRFDGGLLPRTGLLVRCTGARSAVDAFLRSKTMARWSAVGNAAEYMGVPYTY